MTASRPEPVHALRWPARRAAIDHNARRWAAQAAAIAAVAAAVATLTAPLGIGLLLDKVLVVAVPIAVGVGIRLGVLSIALKQARHRGRRALLRWIPRAIWVVALWGYGWAVVPGVNVLAVPATVVVHVALVALYTRFTVDREARGLAPHVLEWGLLVFGALLVLTSLVLAAVLAAALGLTLHALGELLGWTS